MVSNRASLNKTIVMAAAFAVGNIHAAEFPCWRGADGSGAGVDCGKPMVSDLKDATWAWTSEEKRMSSSYDIMSGTISGPIYADGKLYQIWSFPGGAPDPIKANARDVWDKTGTPKYQKQRQKNMDSMGITNDEFFEIICRSRMDDFLICIDASTGKTVWKQQFKDVAKNYNNVHTLTGQPLFTSFGKPKNGPLNTPCVAYGKLAAIGIGGMLYCVDAATGKELWRKQVANLDKAGKPMGDDKRPNLCGASVLYGGGNFICQMSDRYAAFDATSGEVKWKDRSGSGMGSQGGIRFSAGGRDLLMLGASCVDAATGQELWKVDGSGPHAAGNGYVVFGGGNKTSGMTAYRLNADIAVAPEKAWSQEANVVCAHDCYPLIYKGYVYTKMPNPGASVRIVCIELASGKLVAQAGFHSDSHNSMAGGDGRFFYEGIGVIADPAKFALMPGSGFGDGTLFEAYDGSTIWANCATPCYAEGRLYLKGRSYIRCLDLRAK